MLSNSQLRRVGGYLLLALLVSLLSACEPGGVIEPKPDNTVTDGLECSRGVLSTDGKSCINAINCGGDSNKCIEGLVCKGDRCINKECGEGIGDCLKGRCSDEGLCVSRDVCQATDPTGACVEGDVCIAQKCVPVKKCSEVGTCAGGDTGCELMKQNCLETKPCTSSDHCRTQNYCANQECKLNRCLDNGVEKDCAAQNGGVCNPTNGKCESATVCTKASECIDDSDLDKKQICVTDPADASASDKKCLVYNQVCDKVCRDITKCTYDEATTTIACNVGGACSSINDCKKDEYCDGTSCQAIANYTCAAETTPNDDKANATDFDNDQTDGVIADLSLCPSDTDVFVINNVSKYTSVGSVFVAEVVYDEASRGRQVDAEMTVEFVSVDPTTNAESTRTETVKALRKEPSTATVETYQDDMVYFEDISSMANLSKIYITVKHASDTNPLGIDYSLTVKSRDQGLYGLCRDKKELTFTTNTQGNLEARLLGESLVDPSVGSAASFAPHAACLDSLGNKPELAYGFKVEGKDPKKVSISVTPTSNDLDVVLVLLKGCDEGKLDLNPKNIPGCVDAQGVNTRETYQSLLEPGEYTVVATVKDNKKIGGGLFDLEVTLTDVACDPVTQNECTGSGEKVVCDPYRTTLLPAESCPDGCFDYGEGRVGCKEDFGSFCSNPHVVKVGQDIVNLERDTANMVGQTSNSRFDCDSKLDQDSVSGGEVYVLAEIPPGHTAVVKATPVIPVGSSSENVGKFLIYTTKGCQATTCESTSVRGWSRDHVSLLSYKNESTIEQKIYFVIESSGTYQGKVTIDAKIVDESTTPLGCKPGASSCANPAQMTVCQEDGSGGYHEVSVDCGLNLVCVDTQLAPSCELGGDTCEKPASITGIGWVDFVQSELTDTYGIPKGCPDALDGLGVSDWGYWGENDFVVTAKGNVGDYIEISSLRPDNQPVSVYELTGCPAPTSNFCKVSRSTSYDLKKVLLVPATGSEQYFVIENRNSRRPAPIQVKVDILQGGCHELLSKPTCNGDVVTYCDRHDIKRELKCATSCLSDPARCALQSNEAYYAEACPTAPLLNESAQSGSFTAGFDNNLTTQPTINAIQLESGLNGECSAEGNAADSNYINTTGYDKLYAFRLNQNDVLKYRVNTGSPHFNDNFRAYILNDTCTRFGCMNMRDRHFIKNDGNPFEVSGDEYRYYHSRATASTSEVVYLVLDATQKLNSSYAISVMWEVEIASVGSQPQPFATTCDGNNVTFYGADGTSSKNAPCDSGTSCKNGACQPIAGTSGKIVGDTCDDNAIQTYSAPGAYVLESGSSSSLNLTNNLQPSCGAANLKSDGDDYFFKVNVPQGKTLVVRGISASVGSPVVYIGESCDKLKNNDECLAAASGGEQYALESDHAIAEYYNGTGADKVVTVGLDSSRQATNPEVNEAYYYTIDFIDTPGCTFPGEVQCVTAGTTSKLVTCRLGQEIDVPNGTCPGACHATITDECKLEGSTPKQAYELTKPANFQTTAVNTRLASSSDRSSKLALTYGGDTSLVYGSCPFYQRPIGPDQYYKINLTAGDYLEATLQADTSNDEGGFQFYLLAADGVTCISLAQSVTPTSKLKSESLTINFQAFKGGDYYLVVDNRHATVDPAKSKFVIKYKVTPKGSDCVEYMSECKDGQTLTICDPGSSTPSTPSTKDVTCQNGCVGRACRVVSSSGSYNTCDATNATAIELPTVLIYDTAASALNLTNQISASNTCGTIDQNAKNDAFVKVHLDKNEFIGVRDIRSHYSVDPAFYVVTDTACTGGSFTCDAGKVAEEGAYPDLSTKMRYTPLGFASYSSPQDVYLGMTIRVPTTYSESALVFVNKSSVLCKMNSQVTCNSGEITYCKDPGLAAATYTCPATASACNGIVCQAASTKVGNDPLAPIDLDALTWTVDSSTNEKTLTYSGTTVGLDNSYGDENIKGPCFNWNMGGNDSFHKVTLQKGQTLTVKSTVTGAGLDHALYMFEANRLFVWPENKIGPFPTCLAESDIGPVAENISYTHPATAAGPITLIIVSDSYDGGPSVYEYSYDLELKISPAP